MIVNNLEYNNRVEVIGVLMDIRVLGGILM